jgi:hypothetical protein
MSQANPAKPPVPAQIAADPLLQLELRIARRADELARSAAARTALNLRHWLQAEEEILHRFLAGKSPEPGNPAGVSAC